MPKKEKQEEEKKVTHKVKQRFYVAAEVRHGFFPVVEVDGSNEGEKLVRSRLFYEKYPWLTGLPLSVVARRVKESVVAAQGSIKICEACGQSIEGTAELQLTEQEFETILLTREELTPTPGTTAANIEKLATDELAKTKPAANGQLAETDEIEMVETPPQAPPQTVPQEDAPMPEPAEETPPPPDFPDEAFDEEVPPLP